MLSGMHVSLLSSLDPHCRGVAAARLAATHPGSVVLQHDLLDGGIVLRTAYDGGRLAERAQTTLEHGCLTCTVRLDVVPAIERHLGAGTPHVVAALPAGVGVGMVLAALGEAFGLDADGRGIHAPLRIDTAALAVDPSALEESIWERATLFESSLTASPDDDRTPGEFLVGELAAADTAFAVPGLAASLLATGAEEAPAWALGTELLSELAPHAAVVRPDDSLPLPRCRFDGPEAAARSRRGEVRVPAAGVSERFGTLHHRLERPLHPGRLREALPELAAGSHWLRGRLWVASAPGQRIAVNGVGPRVWFEATGPWPDAPEVPGAPRRCTEVAVTADAEDLDAEGFRGLLDDCQLTPAELAAGSEAFAADPFGFADA